ncbi:Rab-GTPase-TBC domain [Dillenia turbinata]|uniref:Rab-GTPase-TBC domain n=1 Tax=Dillenia turbinata TaxID=194707 RepID=A0AAN8VNM4_9MAGN
MDLRMSGILHGYKVTGMSDLLSSILYVMRDECEAFWCFVALMEHLGPNFNHDQNGMHSQPFALSKLIGVWNKWSGFAIKLLGSNNLDYSYKSLNEFFEKHTKDRYCQEEYMIQSDAPSTITSSELGKLEAEGARRSATPTEADRPRGIVKEGGLKRIRAMAIRILGETTSLLSELFSLMGLFDPIITFFGSFIKVNELGAKLVNLQHLWVVGCPWAVGCPVEQSTVLKWLAAHMGSRPCNMHTVGCFSMWLTKRCKLLADSLG